MFFHAQAAATGVRGDFHPSPHQPIFVSPFFTCSSRFRSSLGSTANAGSTFSTYSRLLDGGAATQRELHSEGYCCLRQPLASEQRNLSSVFFPQTRARTLPGIQGYMNQPHQEVYGLTTKTI